MQVIALQDRQNGTGIWKKVLSNPVQDQSDCVQQASDFAALRESFTGGTKSVIRPVAAISGVLKRIKSAKNRSGSL